MKLNKTQSDFFKKGDRQKLVFRLFLLGLLAGGTLGFSAIKTAKSDSHLSDRCLASYAQQVGQIPFDVMQDCAID
jgi:hypothetical protein